jgi:hypothetical protein
MSEDDVKGDLIRLPGPGPGLPARTRRPTQAGSLSTQASPSTQAGSPSVVLRYLDVVLVVLAVPVALALEAPAVGVVVSAAAWLIQRMLARTVQRWIASRGANARFGLNLVDGFGRIWLLAGAIVLAAVIGGRRDGLAAALLIFCAYSIAFAMRVVEGRPGGPRP